MNESMSKKIVPNRPSATAENLAARLVTVYSGDQVDHPAVEIAGVFVASPKGQQADALCDVVRRVLANRLDSELFVWPIEWSEVSPQNWAVSKNGTDATIRIWNGEHFWFQVHTDAENSISGFCDTLAEAKTCAEAVMVVHRR